MLRLIAASVLVSHLLVMMLVAASGREMIVAGILACYLCLLFVYFRKRAFRLFVMIGLVLYLAVLLVAYGALVIGSFQIGRPVNIWFHSFVFLPGIGSASGYAWYAIQDKKLLRGSA